MTSTPPIPPPVNHRPLYRLGQSVLLLKAQALGVVVGISGDELELAVWPSRRHRLARSEVRHLTAADTCARAACRTGVDELGGWADNVCAPRPRDGRCHWCDRDLDVRTAELELERREWGPDGGAT